MCEQSRLEMFIRQPFHQSIPNDDKTKKEDTTWTRKATDRRQWKTLEDIDGGLHPAADGQSLGERWNRKATDRRQWKTLMEGYIQQWMDKA